MSLELLHCTWQTTRYIHFIPLWKKWQLEIGMPVWTTFPSYSNTSTVQICIPLATAVNIVGPIDVYFKSTFSFSQGASPAEIQQKMNAAATPNLVTDDQYGFGTFTPAANPTATDESSTPNRVLYAFLFAQVQSSGRQKMLQTTILDESVRLASDIFSPTSCICA